MSQVSEDLQAAAAVIVRRGWCQGRMWDHTGRVCVVGAIRVATTGKVSGELTLEESHRFHEARHCFHMWLGEAPTVWNDNEGRRGLEAHRALLKAARRC